MQGLRSEFPSPRWICLKRLSELHLPRFEIRVSVSLKADHCSSMPLVMFVCITLNLIGLSTDPGILHFSELFLHCSAHIGKGHPFGC